MNLIVLGSGGCTPLPRPCCNCRLCREAREKGIPYWRTGQSLFLEDINAVFDTPEEISHQLNRENIKAVDHIFFTHWHPDHTMGMRIGEQINISFLAWYVERKMPSRKVEVHALPEVMSDLKAIRNKHGSFLDYYERVGVISCTTLKAETPLRIEDVEIVPIPVRNPGFVSTVFVMKSHGKKVAYAPCDTKPFPVCDELMNLDVLLIGGILPDGMLKNGYEIPEDNELRNEVFSLDELKEIITTLKIKRTVGVHIEEEFGRSYDDYKEIEKENKKYNIEFGFDGMKIKV